MRKTIVGGFLLMVASAVLGATVLQEPFAEAARGFQEVIVANDADNAVPTREQNVDADGNVEVSDASSRGAVRHHGRSTDPAVVPIVPEGKTFVISYVNINGRGRADTDVTAAECDLRRTRLLDDGFTEVSALWALPVTLSGKDAFAVSESMSLPLTAGEGLAYQCIIEPWDRPGQSPLSTITVVGHYVPAP